ncbi:hypothetical protein AYI69_g11149 [Smittium culicis]|uniref:Uncharacterized protein n=1 Tax=Smittium culicis TaxID=133412 RepID=A0A1R1X0V3_9FUNG|nr:hypothetical protein AYI69_g11149 [Smittium culicis]
MSTTTENIKVITFEGLPSRFKGDSKDIESLEVWSPKFKNITSLKGWSHDQSLKVFNTWLEGPVALWQYEKEESMKENNDTTIKTVDDWINALIDGYKTIKN